GAHTAAERDVLALHVDEDLGVRGSERLVVPQDAPHLGVDLLFRSLERAIGSAYYPGQSWLQLFCNARRSKRRNDDEPSDEPSDVRPPRDPGTGRQRRNTAENL